MLRNQIRTTAKVLRYVATTINSRQRVSFYRVLNMRHEIDKELNKLLEEMFELERDEAAYRHNLLASKIQA